MSSRTRFYNRYRPYRSNIASRARNQQRAADQQRDSTTVVINANTSFDCGQTINEIYTNKGDDGWFDTGCMAINIYDVLRNSEYFQNFSPLYDQVKIDNVRARIIATNWATSGAANDNEKINEIIKAKSYVIVTAWDRSGISKDQVVFDDKWDETVENKKFYLKIGKDITTYSSAKTKHLGPGNAYEIVRQLYPENLMEKTQYVNTSLLKRQQVRVNTEYFPYNCFFKKVVDESVNSNGYVYEAYDFNTKYPSNLIADPAVPFKPTLLVNVISGPSPYVTNIKQKDSEGFYTLLTIGVNKIKPVTFDVEFDITCTFRGLRYNRNISKAIEVIPEVVKPLYKEDDSDVNQNYAGHITEIGVSDSKYNNSITYNAQYGFGGTERYPALPSGTGNRYIVYLKTVPIENQQNKFTNKIFIINSGISAFIRSFKNNEKHLLTFVSDKYVLDGIDDYVNIIMYSPANQQGVKTAVFKKSIKINVPIVADNNNHDVEGTLLTNVPDGFMFYWDDDRPGEGMEEDQNMEEINT